MHLAYFFQIGEALSESVIPACLDLLLLLVLYFNYVESFLVACYLIEF